MRLPIIHPPSAKEKKKSQQKINLIIRGAARRCRGTEQTAEQCRGTEQAAEQCRGTEQKAGQYRGTEQTAEQCRGAEGQNERPGSAGGQNAAADRKGRSGDPSRYNEKTGRELRAPGLS